MTFSPPYPTQLTWIMRPFGNLLSLSPALYPRCGRTVSLATQRPDQVNASSSPSTLLPLYLRNWIQPQSRTYQLNLSASPPSRSQHLFRFRPAGTTRATGRVARTFTTRLGHCQPVPYFSFRSHSSRLRGLRSSPPLPLGHLTPLSISKVSHHPSLSFHFFPLPLM